MKVEVDVPNKPMVAVDLKQHFSHQLDAQCEPVWPSVKALRAGKRRGLGSNPLWLSFLFKTCSLWTRSCDFVPHSLRNNKMALITAHLNA